MELFWTKKMFVSYILSILVLLIHLSTFKNYEFNDSIIQNLFLNIIPSVAVPLFFYNIRCSFLETIVIV